MNRFAWLAVCGGAVTAWALASTLGGCGSDETPATVDGDGGTSTSSGSSSGGSSGASSSGGSSGTSSGGDSGNDGAASSSGGTSNPGKITCGATECGDAGAVCCYELAGGADAGITKTCQEENDCSGAKLECDEAADCPDFADGEVCCGEITGGGNLQARCKNDCGNNEPQLCKTAAECGDGGACTEYTCPLIGKVRACVKPTGCN